MKKILLCLLFMYSFALFAKTPISQDLVFTNEEQHIILENEDFTDLYSSYPQDQTESNAQYDLERQILEKLNQTSSYLAFTQDQEKILHLNQQNKDLYLNPDFRDPLIIFAFAHWCGACRQLNPIVEQLNEEHGQKYQFLKLDVDNQAEITRSFGITVIPTVIVVKKGEVTGLVIGSMTKQALWDRIKALLND
jgi:thioredoxin 1